jgi:translation initiation factor eIF-2B subunit delta
MGNAIRWLKVAISAVDPDTPESTAKEDLCDAIDSFIRERITVAGQVIASSATEKIRDGDVILTYAKSSTVQQALLEAFLQGKKFRVIVMDSRPLFEGKNLARALADLGLKVEYSLMHAISHTVKDATKVFLGAHAMMSNGRLYSRAGSAIVAMMANHADIPVIVCCESVKFTDRVALDSIVTNEVAPPDELLIQGSGSTELSKWQETPNLQLLNLMYDLTPAEYINMVITEYGGLPPSSVPVVHRLSTDT